MQRQQTTLSTAETETAAYLPVLFSTLAISWLALSGYALFIFLTGHYGLTAQARPCFVAWDIQLILTHLGVVLTQNAKHRV